MLRSLGRLGVPVAGILPDAGHEVFLVSYRRWDEASIARPSCARGCSGSRGAVAAGMRAKCRELPTDVEPPAATVDPLVAKRDLLWRALDTLDDDRRVVVVLHDLEGHTGAEIGVMLDLPVNTVHSRLRLARADLLAAVRKLGGAP